MLNWFDDCHVKAQCYEIDILSSEISIRHSENSQLPVLVLYKATRRILFFVSIRIEIANTPGFVGSIDYVVRVRIHINICSGLKRLPF